MVAFADEGISALARMSGLSLSFVRWMRKGRMPSKHGTKQYYKGRQALANQLTLTLLGRLGNWLHGTAYQR